MTEKISGMGLSDSMGLLTYRAPILGNTKLCKVKMGKDTHPVDAILWTRKRLLIGNFHQNCWVILLNGKPLVKPLALVLNTPPSFSIKKNKTEELCLHIENFGDIRITCIMEGHQEDVHFKDQKGRALKFYPVLSENLQEQKGVTLHMFDK